MKNQYVVIMAGGIGSRFWPFSRNKFPKQFHDILGNGKTMLQETAERFEGICPKENLYIVTNKDYLNLVKESLPWISEDQILLEPMPKNTAPCIAYACYKISHKNPDANIVITPADHVVTKPEEFRSQIAKALNATKNDDILVTLGLMPSRPDTGYGYIQFIENEGSEIKKVKTFTEKPLLDLALTFIKSGDFVWNAGIFVWNAKSFIKAFEELVPELHDIFKEGNNHYYTESESAFINNVFPQCKSISIDYAVMEKANNVFVLLSEFGWSDLGTWKSLYEQMPKDENGNAIKGNVKTYDTIDSIIRMPSDKLVVVEGLEGYIVAESDGVIMICRKENEQRVKEFVADIKKDGLNQFV